MGFNSGFKGLKTRMDWVRRTHSSRMWRRSVR